MLSTQQLAEVVEFDRSSRERDARIFGVARRRTNRYNYIVPRPGPKALGEALGYDKPKPPGVCIVNVAVRPDADNVPIAKEVMWTFPETGMQYYADVVYRGIAGWIVTWSADDIARKGGRRGKEPFRIGKKLDRSPATTEIIHGREGLNRTNDPTVNPQALEGTRYRYCRYDDDAPCAAGLVEWLALYRDEPRVELLAKAGLFCFINPAGVKALKDRRVFAWARGNAETLRRLGCPPVSHVLYAARHGTTLKKARDHFSLVRDMRDALSYLSQPGRGRAGIKPRLDWERLAELLKKWGVDTGEYGRYLVTAFDCDRDLLDEGTLYPPARGGRRAFMERLEELEREKERMERARRRAAEAAEAAAMAERGKEIDAFQQSLERDKTVNGLGYSITLARSQRELRAEGLRMHNCVGNGTYWHGIATGDTLIVMVGRCGRSYCDIEISRRNWTVWQCYLKRNTRPPEKVSELAKRIAEILKAEHRRHRERGLFKAPRRASS